MIFAVPRKLNIAILPAFALAACAANTNQEGLAMDDEIACSLTGEEFAGAKRDEICSAFLEVLPSSGRGDIARVELEATSRTDAKARITDGSGRVLVEMDHAIMDREMSLDSWQVFARSVARQLGR